jgi:multidrug efflux pump subunit AcrA (membrane-fusion protein)
MGLDRLVTIMPRNQRKRNRITFVLFAAATLWWFAGCDQGPAAAVPQSSSSPSSNPATDRVPLATTDLPSRAAAHAAGEGRDFTTSGPLVVEQQADVVSERDGRVTAVSVEIGDHVHRGEVLALLDDRALQAALAEKAARIESLRAQVQEWEAEQKSNEADLRRADAMRSE